MLQQLPLALLLYTLGGMPWLVWGVCVRVATGVSMHWFVGYICHSHGPQSWHVNNGAIQAHNVPWAAIPSMGESWHNNHHAFPASARHGLYPGQLDLDFYAQTVQNRPLLDFNYGDAVAGQFGLGIQRTTLHRLLSSADAGRNRICGGRDIISLDPEHGT